MKNNTKKLFKCCLSIMLSAILAISSYVGFFSYAYAAYKDSTGDYTHSIKTIQNGDFEAETFTDYSKNRTSGNDYYTSQKAGKIEYWYTSATDSLIEFFRGAYGYYTGDSSMIYPSHFKYLRETWIKDSVNKSKVNEINSQLNAKYQAELSEYNEKIKAGEEAIEPTKPVTRDAVYYSQPADIDKNDESNPASEFKSIELNANEDSTIYQKINTISGSTYTWGISHRGRDSVDTMVLIVGAEQKEYTSNGSLEDEYGKYNEVDPSKSSKYSKDQFMRITAWLKQQKTVISKLPSVGCSQKITVYTKPFRSTVKDSSGKSHYGEFQNESADENENISFVRTNEINQEWSCWIISSDVCNTEETRTVNGKTIYPAVHGWSNYGTNAYSVYSDILQGSNSVLEYDCTFTVPKGQTTTIFGFCSVSGIQNTKKLSSTDLSRANGYVCDSNGNIVVSSKNTSTYSQLQYDTDYYYYEYDGTLISKARYFTDNNLYFVDDSGSEVDRKIQNNTIGNLIDNINFRLYHPVTATITDGGVAKFITNASTSYNVDASDITTKTVTSNSSIKGELALDGIDGTIYTTTQDPINSSDIGKSYIIDDETVTITEENLETYAGRSRSGHEFQGAYIIMENLDGTTTTLYMPKYESASDVPVGTPAYFLRSDPDKLDLGDYKYTYAFRSNIVSSFKIHMIYGVAPYVLYDANGGKDYQYSTRMDDSVYDNYVDENGKCLYRDANGNLLTDSVSKKDSPYYVASDNEEGYGLVGFGINHYKWCPKEEAREEQVNRDTTPYFRDVIICDGVDCTHENHLGYYYSHPAQINDSWVADSATYEKYQSDLAKYNAKVAAGDTTAVKPINPEPVFANWLTSGKNGDRIYISGKHKITYSGTEKEGTVTIYDDENSEVTSGLNLDATHGITLTAQWKFVTRAIAQTVTNNSSENIQYNNYDPTGGWVTEKMLDRDANEVVEYIDDEYTSNYSDTQTTKRINSIDTVTDSGEIIMFNAQADYEHNYVFVGWYTYDEETGKEVLKSTSPNLIVTAYPGKIQQYYARFAKQTVTVTYHYSEDGNPRNYSYYDADADHKFGKYYEEINIGSKISSKPTDDSKKVKSWFTSSTQRGADTLFDFSNTVVTHDIDLYASPSFTFNYSTTFRFVEPWNISTYSTLKFNGSYIDMLNNSKITDYNVYMLRGNSVGEDTPTATSIKENPNTYIVSKSSDKIISNQLTSGANVYNRIGALYDKMYIFNMKTPLWVVFDFEYNGITYTSAVKDRCLYNNITSYFASASSGMSTDYKATQDALLYSIQAMYDAVSVLGISEPTEYEPSINVSELTYNSLLENTYSFTSSTAIRNIEPWGFKYEFSVDEHTVGDFYDFGAVVFTDTNGIYDGVTVTPQELINNDKSVMYSYNNENAVVDKGNMIVYHVGDVKITNYDKNTYVVFFVKDSDGNCYYSNVISNSYKSIAEERLEAKDADETEKAILRSILNYAKEAVDYKKLEQ